VGKHDVRFVSGFVWRLSWGLFFHGEYFFRRVAMRLVSRNKLRQNAISTNVVSIFQLKLYLIFTEIKL